MRKIIYSTIIATMSATMMFAQPVLAAIPEIDLESMTNEELIILRDSVNEKIAENGGDNVIGVGTYEVGKDIKVSNFKLTASPNYNGFTQCRIFKNNEEYEEYENGSNNLGDYFSIYGHENSGYESISIKLSEGEIFYIESGSAIIEEIKGSWMPDETDKETTEESKKDYKELLQE